MTQKRRSLTLVGFCLLLASPLGGQAPRDPGAARWQLSLGLGGNPLVGTEHAHALGTLLVSRAPSPLEARLDVLAAPGRSAPGGVGTASANLLLRLPAISGSGRTATPYLVGGLGAAIGGVGHPTRWNGGLGLRAPTRTRAVFVEGRVQQHTGGLFTVGWQF